MQGTDGMVSASRRSEGAERAIVNAARLRAGTTTKVDTRCLARVLGKRDPQRLVKCRPFVLVQGLRRIIRGLAVCAAAAALMCASIPTLAQDEAHRLGKPASSSAHGTLVVAIAAKDGLVICADRMTVDTVRGAQENTTKITRLSSTVALAITGTPLFYDIYDTKPTGHRLIVPSYDAELVIRSYTEIVPFEDTPAYWELLSQLLIATFRRHLSHYTSDAWPPSGDGENHTMYQAVFFRLDEARKPRVSILQFRYINGAEPEMSIEKREVLASELATAKPHAFGNTKVFSELKAGSDARFSDLRKNRLLVQFLGSGQAIGKVTTRKALEVAKQLVRVTSERSHLIDSSTANVGVVTDCAILDYKTGFRWLK